MYAWGPAKYGGYRSNHLRARVSPRYTRSVTDSRVCTHRIMCVCAYVEIRSDKGAQEDKFSVSC